ncbi:MAG: redoxin domain-containing protein [Acidimicrobiales bacterium]
MGQPAPDFSLPSTSGADVTLSSSRGAQNALVAFFPLAFTRVCTTELNAFCRDFDRFGGIDTSVLPISVDSVPALREFRSKHGMCVHLLSDFRRDVSRRYGVLREEDFFSERAYFLIDKDGVLRWAHVEASLEHRREDAELLRRIEAL